jgi:hypothetical protein
MDGGSTGLLVEVGADERASWVSLDGHPGSGQICLEMRNDTPLLGVRSTNCRGKVVRRLDRVIVPQRVRRGFVPESVPALPPRER